MIKKPWPRAQVAVDVVAVTVLESDCKVLLVRRDPAQPTLALPGGLVHCGDGVRDQGEDVPAAARRALLELTHIEAGALVLVKAFSAPFRDPCTRIVSVAFLTVVRPEVAAFVRARADAAVRWFAARDLDKITLALDHNEIARVCLERLRQDMEAGHHEQARELVPRVFSMAELRASIDAVTGGRSDPGNFRRRFLRWVDDGVIAAAAGQRVTSKRPAGVWSYSEGRTPGLVSPRGQ